MNRKHKLVLALAAVAVVSTVAGVAHSAFPGRNGLIAFEAYSRGGILVMNADGSAQRVVAEGGFLPAWAPDGRTLAFESFRTGGGDIYVVDSNGSGLRQVTFSTARDSDPSWAPDGRRIAFESTRAGDTDVYVINSDSSGERRLTDHPAFDGDPAFSPDGTRIAFASLRDGNYEIYVMNADGSGVTRLTNDGGAVPDPSLHKVDQNPKWSPDGRLLVFDSTRDGNREVYVMNADGSGQRNLSDHPALDALAAFSPDGRKIVFTSERGEGGNRDVWAMNADGSGKTRLTSLGNWDQAPDWGRVPSAAAPGPRTCTVSGTNGPDRLYGTLGPDVICGLKGNDELHGRGGNDTLLGGPGDDYLDGGPGADTIDGGDGNDRIFARDGKRDVIRGGPGRDRAVVDKFDVVTGVEVVVRPKKGPEEITDAADQEQRAQREPGLAGKRRARWERRRRRPAVRRPRERHVPRAGLRPARAGPRRRRPGARHRRDGPARPRQGRRAGAALRWRPHVRGRGCRVPATRRPAPCS